MKTMMRACLILSMLVLGITAGWVASESRKGCPCGDSCQCHPAACESGCCKE